MFTFDQYWFCQVSTYIKIKYNITVDDHIFSSQMFGFTEE